MAQRSSLNTALPYAGRTASFPFPVCACVQTPSLVALLLKPGHPGPISQIPPGGGGVCRTLSDRTLQPGFAVTARSGLLEPGLAATSLLGSPTKTRIPQSERAACNGRQEITHKTRAPRSHGIGVQLKRDIVAACHVGGIRVESVMRDRQAGKKRLDVLTWPNVNTPDLSLYEIVQDKVFHLPEYGSVLKRSGLGSIGGVHVDADSHTTEMQAEMPARLRSANAESSRTRDLETSRT
ncbi:hypothetical protein H4582DRAFT_2064651 [Lactarius indigo]|nr:hypothetical protein H4582DRAFT_2064651 [Lactarius indigo]